MGRGLDGCFYFLLWSCAVFKLHRGAVSQYFRWCIARGKHLFPFRTEQLSLSAPMVLGGKPPGRVGRRRFFLRKAALGRLFGVLGPPGSAFSEPLRAEDERPIGFPPPQGGACRSAALAAAGLAARRRSPNGL